jgi:hypothetical protein
MATVQELVLLSFGGAITFALLKLWEALKDLSPSADDIRWAKIMRVANEARREIDAR